MIKSTEEKKAVQASPAAGKSRGVHEKKLRGRKEWENGKMFFRENGGRSGVHYCQEGGS